MWVFSRLLKIDGVCPSSWFGGCLTNHLCMSDVFMAPSLGFVWAAMERSGDYLSVLGKYII